MGVEEESRTEILHANRALRDWAEGLRVWSQTARETAAAQRARAHTLIHRDLVECGCPEPLQYVTGHRDETGMPSLELIDVEELVGIVTDRLRIEHDAAERAVRRGVLYAGYRPESDRVTAADAFDIVEEALRFQV